MTLVTVICTWEDGAESVYGPCYPAGATEAVIKMTALRDLRCTVRVLELEKLEALEAIIDGAATHVTPAEPGHSVKTPETSERSGPGVFQGVSVEALREVCQLADTDGWDANSHMAADELLRRGHPWPEGPKRRAAEKCEWCGGDADPTTVCPKSIECPTCGAGPGKSCRRPSGHRASILHSPRISTAERHVRGGS